MHKNTIISYIFILVIFYFPIHTTFHYIYTHQNNIKIKNKKIDWEKLYPFSHKKVKKDLNIIEKINDLSDNFKNFIEEGFNANIPNRYKLCEIQMFIEKLLGKNLFLEYRGSVVLNNGYLDSHYKYKSPKKALDSTLDFVEFLNQIGSDFVFVLYPSKNSKFNNQLPKGLKDNNNITSDEFLNVLNQNKINTLDLRENARKEYKYQYEMFFKTDIHWKPSAGLWASKEICNYLKNNYNWEINTFLLQKENFNFTTLSKILLGSQGQQLTLAYCEPDDLDIIKPNFDTSFQRFCPEWKDATGTFDEIMFNKNHLEKGNLYKIKPYECFLNGDMAYLRLINNSNYALNKKILLIKDSFSRVVAPFLALCFKDLTLLDVRHFNGSVRNLLLKEKFDLVIIAYNARFIAFDSEKYPKFRFE